MFTTYFWLIEVYEGHPEKNKSLAYNFVLSYLAAYLILPMIPMSIFGIALRKVKQFADTSDDKTLAMNQQMFSIHLAILTIMFLSTFVIAVTCIVNFAEIMHTCGCPIDVRSRNDFKGYSIMQMVTFVIMGIAYSTMYYLLWIFATPIKISSNELGPLTEENTVTPGGPDDVLDYLKEHIEETSKLHRRGTMKDHQSELDKAFGYKQISTSTESLPQLILRNKEDTPLLD